MVSIQIEVNRDRLVAKYNNKYVLYILVESRDIEMAGAGQSVDETRTVISKCAEPSQHSEQA